MTEWLTRFHRTPSVVDGLFAFQTTGSLVPALIAFATPLLRRAVLPSKDQ